VLAVVDEEEAAGLEVEAGFFRPEMLSALRGLDESVTRFEEAAGVLAGAWE
jgi:hypothetical protein